MCLFRPHEPESARALHGEAPEGERHRIESTRDIPEDSLEAQAQDPWQSELWASLRERESTTT